MIWRATNPLICDVAPWWDFSHSLLLHNWFNLGPHNFTTGTKSLQVGCKKRAPERSSTNSCTPGQSLHEVQVLVRLPIYKRVTVAGCHLCSDKLRCQKGGSLCWGCDGWWMITLISGVSWFSFCLHLFVRLNELKPMHGWWYEKRTGLAKPGKCEW